MPGTFAPDPVRRSLFPRNEPVFDLMSFALIKNVEVITQMSLATPATVTHQGSYCPLFIVYWSYYL